MKPVATENTAAFSAQAARPRSARHDPPQARDDFSEMIDSKPRPAAPTPARPLRGGNAPAPASRSSEARQSDSAAVRLGREAAGDQDDLTAPATDQTATASSAKTPEKPPTAPDASKTAADPTLADIVQGGTSDIPAAPAIDAATVGVIAVPQLIASPLSAAPSPAPAPEAGNATAISQAGSLSIALPSSAETEPAAQEAQPQAGPTTAKEAGPGEIGKPATSDNPALAKMVAKSPAKPGVQPATLQPEKAPDASAGETAAADPAPAAGDATQPLVPALTPAAVAPAAKIATLQLAAATPDAPLIPALNQHRAIAGPEPAATVNPSKPAAIGLDAAMPDAAPAPQSDERRAVPASQTKLTDLIALTSSGPQSPPAMPAAASPLSASVQAVPIASATIPVPLDGVAMQIAALAHKGNTSFEIRLDPAELGRIDVRMDVDRHGNVTSHLTVEKPETLAMLRQDAPQLQRALHDAGLKTSDNGLQFSLGDQSASNPNNGRNDANDGSRPQRLTIRETESRLAPPPPRSYGRPLASRSGIDIRI